MSANQRLFSFTFPFGHYRADVLLGSSVFSSQFALKDATGGITSANVDNLCVGNANVGMGIAVRMSALLKHVIMVVLACAKKQVIGVDAPSIVARMKYPKFVRQLAMCEYPRKPVGANQLVAPMLEHAVAAGINAAPPQPTVIGAALVYLFPKAFRDGTIGRWLMTANVLTLLARKFMNGNNFPTTTFAEDGTRGMILHSNVSFVDLLTPQDGSTHRCGNYLPASIVPQEAQYV